MNTIRDEVLACLQLNRWHGVNQHQKKEAVIQVGSCLAAAKLTRSDWESLTTRKLGSKTLVSDCNIDLDLQWLKRSGNHFIAMTDSHYPKELLTLYDAPVGLFVGGDLTALQTLQVAIVGSRRQTPLGRKIARQFSQGLVQSGLGVISGLAKGIDASAHQACCEVGGQTIAVAGCGLDIIYPRENRALAHNVQKQGCIISEYPIGVPPKKEHFPARNRIIAAIALGVVVVEAAQRSGSLITARLAAEQGKEVFAIPGSILSSQSAGCHHLIQQGAVLAQSVEDVLLELRLPISRELMNQKSPLNEGDLECEVLQSIAYESTRIEEIIASSSMDIQQLTQRLIELELDGLIARAHNGDYFRIT